MKQKTNQFKQLLTFTILAGFLFGCNIEEEYVTKQYQQSRNLKIRYLKGKEAMLKGKILESKLTLSNKVDILSRTNIALSTNEGVIDYTKVLEVIDAEGNINYTFNILNHPEDSQTVFHNLVLNNTTIGTEEIFLLKYTSNTPITTITEFVGTVTTKGISSNTNPCDDSIDDINFQGDYPTGSDNGSATPVPTDNTPVNPTTPGSGGTNGGNSGNTTSDVTFHCNTCNLSSPLLSVMLGHRDDQGKVIPFSIINNRSSGINNNINTNPCDPNGSIGIIDPEEVVKTPCEDLIAKSNDSIMNSKLTDLKIKAGQGYESAHVLYQNATEGLKVGQEFTGDPNATGQGKEVSLGLNANDGMSPINCIGFAHCHLNDNSTFKVFSVSDLIAFSKIVGASTRPTSEFTIYVTTEAGTFALKVTDRMKFKDSFDLMSMSQKLQENKFEEKVTKTMTVQEQKLGLLQFLKNMPLIGSPGLSMFEKNSSTGNWEELSLSENGKNVLTKPCN